MNASDPKSGGLPANDNLPAGLDAPTLDATWPAVSLSALREVAVMSLGWKTQIVAARAWLPNSEWAVLVPVAFCGRSILAGIFVDTESAHVLARRLAALAHAPDDHEVGSALGEFAQDLAQNIVSRRENLIADIGSGTPMVCRGRVDVGGPSHTSALAFEIGEIKGWLALIRPKVEPAVLATPLFG